MTWKDPIPNLAKKSNICIFVDKYMMQLSLVDTANPDRKITRVFWPPRYWNSLWQLSSYGTLWCDQIQSPLDTLQWELHRNFVEMPHKGGPFLRCFTPSRAVYISFLENTVKCAAKESRLWPHLQFRHCAALYLLSSLLPAEA